MDNQKKVSYISKEGYEQLRQEIDELKNAKLPEILNRLAEAKSMGDLSENFEYKAALEDKDFAQSRIHEIEELLENVEIIQEEKKRKHTLVDYGARVVVKIEDEKKEYAVTIVGTGETAIVNDELRISFESPLGAAIQGKKVGETGKMRMPSGRKEVKILDIK